MALPFISKTDLDNYLGYTTDVDKSGIAIDAACDITRKVSGQSLDFVANDVVVLDSEGQESLLLPEMPVYSVASVVDQNNRTLVEGTDYEFDSEAGYLQTKRRGSKFAIGRKVYTVTYTHGYVSDAGVVGLPADVIEWPSALRMVALQLATRIYDQGIVSSESVGGVSMSYAAPEALVLSDRERSLLEAVVGVGRRR